MLRSWCRLAWLLALPLAAQVPDAPLRLADAKAAKCGWGTAHDDASVAGDALAVGDVTADTGIGTHAPAELTFALPTGARWFTCWFGVASERGGSGSIALEVKVDGEKKFASAVQKGGMAPLWVAVDVAGGKEMKLVVTDGGDGNGSDHANLLWPRLSFAAKEPGPSQPDAITFAGKPQPPDGVALWSDRPATKFV